MPAMRGLRLRVRAPAKQLLYLIDLAITRSLMQRRQSSLEFLFCFAQRFRKLLIVSRTPNGRDNDQAQRRNYRDPAQARNDARASFPHRPYVEVFFLQFACH
jgi:hypothetical protein